MTAPFAHITVPVDGSSTAERGVAFALELARDGGTLTFCSVVDSALVCLPMNEGAAIDPGPLLAELDEDAEIVCRRARDEAQRARISADTSVLHGTSIESIGALVRSNGSQAVVIGTNGRSGLARGVLGSVAEGLLSHADVPVIAVHENDVVRTGPVVVALDDSPAARAALEIAANFAVARGMSLLLVHANARDDDRAHSDALIAGAEQRVRARGVTVSSIVRQGRAADMVLAIADEFESCMIVVGTHGRPFLETLVIGSVARRVLERAHIPVIAVRHPGA